MDNHADSYVCPRCGAEMQSEWCSVVGCDDGWVDLYDEDPLWYDPGDRERCDECGGRGFVTWCPACGYDPMMETESEVRHG